MENRWESLGALFQSHPWHGVPIGKDAPNVVTVYVEIVPTDTVKYELDKVTGLLRVDRPQKYSNFCPSLYGLLPQTLCADQVAALSAERTGHLDEVALHGAHARHGVDEDGEYGGQEDDRDLG